MDRKNSYQMFASAMAKVIARQDREEMSEKLIQLEHFADSHPDLEVRSLARKFAAKLRLELA